MTNPPAVWGTAAFEDALSEFDAGSAAVLRLSAELCAVPGITVPAHAADLPALLRTHNIAAERARAAGLRVWELLPGPDAPYPFLVVGFPEHDLADPALTTVIGLIGHLDVVPPSEEGQFAPRLGQHTHQILTEAGYSQAEIDTMTTNLIAFLERQGGTVTSPNEEREEPAS